MAVTKNKTCSTNLDSFFTEIIVDPRGNSITDINAGLDTLFKQYNEEEVNYVEDQRYLVREYEEGYPELVAKNSLLGDTGYWWWFLLINRLDDPFVDIKKHWAYSILNSQTVSDFIESANKSVEAKSTQRIGTVIELN